MISHCIIANVKRFLVFSPSSLWQNSYLYTQMNVIVQVALPLNNWSGFLSKLMLGDETLGDKVYLQSFSANDQIAAKKVKCHFLQKEFKKYWIAAWCRYPTLTSAFHHTLIYFELTWRRLRFHPWAHVFKTHAVMRFSLWDLNVSAAP